MASAFSARTSESPFTSLEWTPPPRRISSAMVRISTSVDSWRGGATKVPLPGVRTSRWAAASSRTARLTVMRATLKRRASSGSEGMRSPSRHSPASIWESSQFLMRR